MAAPRSRFGIASTFRVLAMKARLPFHLLLSLLALVACESPSPVVVPANTSPSSSAGDAVKDGTAKEIVSVQWMSSDFTEEVKVVGTNADVGILVGTRNYEAGETVTAVIARQFDGQDSQDLVVVGTVDPDGYARLRMNVGGKPVSEPLTPDADQPIEQASAPCENLESKAHPPAACAPSRSPPSAP